MNNRTPSTAFTSILAKDQPAAAAWIHGNPDNPNLGGMVSFYTTPFGGVLISAEIFGLPDSSTQNPSDFYGMHIHENGECTSPFETAGGHYNPSGEPHPSHAGDLLSPLGNQGYAWVTFYDKRFTIDQILDKSVIIHRMPDDFSSQPAGASGERIGCGIITPVSVY